MSDDLNITRPADATKINLNQSWEVEYWCKKFNVTENRLRSAVQAVGTSVSAVEKYFR